MEISVIKAAGVSTDNPNLPEFKGVDLSQSMKSVKIEFGVNTNSSDKNSIFLDSDGNASPGAVAQRDVNDIDGNLARPLVSLDDNFFDLGGGYLFTGQYRDGYQTRTGTVFFDGLNPLRRYTLRLLASRSSSSSADRTGIYTFGTITHEIDARDNSDWYEFAGVYPDSTGKLALTCYGKTDDSFVYLNEIELVEL